MATKNPFDLLGDDDSDDPVHLIAAQEKIAAKKPAVPAAAPPAAAKLPTKPAPPAQAVREARSNVPPARGGIGRGGLVGRSRGVRGGGTSQNRDFSGANNNGFSGGYAVRGGGGDVVAGAEDADVNRSSERGHGPQQPFRGGRRGWHGNGEAGDDSGRPPRRMYERRSGTGHGYEMKREGAGRGNWGTVTDELPAQETEETLNTEEKTVVAEKQAEQEQMPSSETTKEKEGHANEAEEKESEDKEMTLEEYERIREEKRKVVLSLKTEERKVEVDKDLQSMQQLSLKKGSEEVFIKLGSVKDSKKKDNPEKDERAKKSLSINEFLKPSEGERYYSSGGRGRGGRGQGERGTFRGGFGGSSTRGPASSPPIGDQLEFPTLGGK